MTHRIADLRSLRTAIPYIRAYKGKVFIIKMGGDLCQSPRALHDLAEQLALLHQIGIRLVLVHGGRPQVDQLAQRLGVPVRSLHGRRLTDDATLEIAQMAFTGMANMAVVSSLRGASLSAVGLTSADGGTLIGRRRPPQPLSRLSATWAEDSSQPHSAATGNASNEETVDFGWVGDITEAKGDFLNLLLQHGHIPVLAPLITTPEGQLLNVNADTVGSAVAVALGAVKYFVLTDVDGVFLDPKDPATLQSVLTLEKADALIKEGCIRGGMLPKLDACRRAILGGVPRVHVINGFAPDALLAEVFTNEGCGTLIVGKEDRIS